MLLLLFGASPLLARANTTDVQLGVLELTSVGELLSFMQRAETDRLLDRKAADLRNEVAERRHEVAERRHEVAERRHEAAERRHEAAERRHESLLQSIDQISDAVVTAATSERVYTCAKAAAVLLQTFTWAGGSNDDSSKLCSAIPLFSAQPQAESTHFLTSAHCFTDITRAETGPPSPTPPSSTTAT